MSFAFVSQCFPASVLSFIVSYTKEVCRRNERISMANYPTFTVYPTIKSTLTIISIVIIKQLYNVCIFSTFLFFSI